MTERNAWIFRRQNHNYDSRNVNLKKWSLTDRRYKNLFVELSKVPDFEKGLYEGGSTFNVDAATKTKFPVAQAQALKELLDEVKSMMDLKHEVHNGKGFYFLM